MGEIPAQRCHIYFGDVGPGSSHPKRQQNHITCAIERVYSKIMACMYNIAAPVEDGGSKIFRRRAVSCAPRREHVQTARGGAYSAASANVGGPSPLWASALSQSPKWEEAAEELIQKIAEASSAQSAQSAHAAGKGVTQGTDSPPTPAWDFAFLFVNVSFAEDFEKVARAVFERLGARALVACLSGGCIGSLPGSVSSPVAPGAAAGGGAEQGPAAGSGEATGMSEGASSEPKPAWKKASKEVEQRAGISLAAARLGPGGRMTPFQLRAGDLDRLLDAPQDAWHTVLGVLPEDAAGGFVVLGDPLRDASRAVEGLDFAYPGVIKVGGLSVPLSVDSGSLLVLRQSEDGSGQDDITGKSAAGAAAAAGAKSSLPTATLGLAGVALSGTCRLHSVVAQGCRGVGPPMTVTSADSGMITSLDGKNPLVALQDSYAGLSDEDKQLMQMALFVGLENMAQGGQGAGVGIVPGVVPGASGFGRGGWGAPGEEGARASGATSGDLTGGDATSQGDSKPSAAAGEGRESKGENSKGDKGAGVPSPPPLPPLPGPGDWLVRNIVGVTQEGGLLVGGELRQGQRIQFHVRDAKASREDIERMFQRYAIEKSFSGVAAQPFGALIFSCLGRGAGLYGVPDHDSRVFARMVSSELGLTGFFCNGEIGSPGICGMASSVGSTVLHGYTSVFGLLYNESKGSE
eukprot:jgi/Mesvir1/9578/Mv16478-RA.1